MFHSEFDLTLYWVLSQLSVLYHFGEKILKFDSHLIFTSKTGKQRSKDVLFRLRVVALCPIATVSFATVSTAASTAPREGCSHGCSPPKLQRESSGRPALGLAS